MNTLFIMEKWCDGNPMKGLTNNFHNLLGTFNNSKKGSFGAVFVDEIARAGQDINSLSEGIEKFDTIVFSFLGDSNVNPSVDTCKRLGKTHKLCFMWPDSGYAWAQARIRSLSEFTHISWGGERLGPLSKKHHYLWTPQDATLYHPDTQDINVSFAGSLIGYSDRKPYLDYVNRNGQIVNIVGGQREQALTAEGYAEVVRKSKININFCESPSGQDQMKGRVLETLSSKSLLLEKSNIVTSQFFVPGIDYVEFTSKEDLEDKIRWLLNSPKDRERIAEKGYNSYITRYSSDIFWDKVEEFLNV